MEGSKSDYIEFVKARIDSFKHLTTLSTGSIIIIATFLEKIFTSPTWKPLIAISLIGFIISICGSVLAIIICIQCDFPNSPNKEADNETVGVISNTSSWIGFLVGIASLAIFALKNLFRE